LKNVKVIADDLTITNSQRLQTAIDKKAGNTILIKLNQIGTLTETLNVIKLAYENNWQAVVSHRSGETMDDFIADLAVAVNAWGLKAGAPAAPERMVKYERVLKIQGTK
jgi:enolase